MRADLDARRRSARPATGVSTAAWFHAHFAAGRGFTRAREKGLDTRIDAAGNHSAVLGRGPRTLLRGSHLDSVPHGARARN
jgi:hypothetical protein